MSIFKTNTTRGGLGVKYWPIEHEFARSNPDTFAKFWMDFLKSIYVYLRVNIHLIKYKYVQLHINIRLKKCTSRLFKAGFEPTPPVFRLWEKKYYCTICLQIRGCDSLGVKRWHMTHEIVCSNLNTFAKCWMDFLKINIRLFKCKYTYI